MTRGYHASAESLFNGVAPNHLMATSACLIPGTGLRNTSCAGIPKSLTALALAQHGTRGAKISTTPVVTERKVHHLRKITLPDDLLGILTHVNRATNTERINELFRRSEPLATLHRATGKKWMSASGRKRIPLPQHLLHVGLGSAPSSPSAIRLWAARPLCYSDYLRFQSGPARARRCASKCTFTATSSSAGVCASLKSSLH